MYKTSPGYTLLKKNYLHATLEELNYKTIEKIGLQTGKRRKVVELYSLW